MTKKPGNFKNKTCNAISADKPDSTIFRIRSNITPTDRETTVKAAIAKNNGGINSPSNHLSSKGISFHLEETQ